MTLSTWGRPGEQAENAAASDTSSVQPPQTQQPDLSAIPTPVQEPTPNTALPADYDKIDAFLYGSGKIDVGIGDANTVAPAAAVVPEKPAEEPAIPPQEPTPVSTEPEKILPNRIGTGQFGARTQRAIALLHELNNGKPEDQGPYKLTDAFKLVDDADAQAAGPAAEKIPDEMETLQSEIQGIEATITQAGEDNSLLTPELAKAMNDVTSKKARLESMKVSRQSDENRSTEEHNRAVQSSKAQVAAEYPSITDSSSILGSRASVIISEWKKSNDPRIFQANAPVLIAEEALKTAADQIVKTFGGTIESAKAQITGKPTVKPVAPEAPKAVPVGGTREVAAAPSGAPVSQAALTEQEILKASENDPDFLDRALGYAPRFMVRG